MKFSEFFCILFIVIKIYNCDVISGKLSYLYRSESKSFNNTDVIPSRLAKSFNLFQILSIDIKKLQKVVETLGQEAVCSGCRVVAQFAIKLVNDISQLQSRNLKNSVIDLCVLFKIQTDDVCKGIINLYWPTIEYIIKANDTEIDANSVCGVLLQEIECGISNQHFDWSLEIDPNYPELNSSKKTSDTYSYENNLKILVLTDIHYDPHYLVGGNANCEEPLCCRNPISLTSISDNRAGKWSDYNNCDVPWNLFADTLDHIQNEHGNFDLIYFTGDVIEHAVWETSKAGNTESIKKIYGHIKEVFGNVTVLPILGNHEPSPVNLYAPSNVTDPNLSTQWLYDLVAKEWKYWVSDYNVNSTIEEGGYYTYSPQKGFRVVSLNNNNAYILNFWILYKPEELKKQLEWLHDVLLEAEKANEYIHILMHVPSGSTDCFDTWSREFRRLIERFHPIIGGIFTGHTHYDEFNVYYSLNNSNYAINVAWNGGSLTPFSYLNPNYRIYEVETTTYQVVKHETWIFNLTDANLHPNLSPRWFKEYSFSDAYDLENLSPDSLNELVERFSKNQTLIYKYWEHKVKYGDPSLKSGCNDKCLEELYCDIVTTQSNDQSKCTYKVSAK